MGAIQQITLSSFSNKNNYPDYSDKGDAIFTTPGTYSWVCPAGVTSVCAVCIGGATDSYFKGVDVVMGGGGPFGKNLPIGGTFVGDGGGNGGGTGSATNVSGRVSGEGGGGAGGYTGDGGKGGSGIASNGTSHCRGGGGGGVGIFGEGPSGIGKNYGSYGTAGGNGSGGSGGNNFLGSYGYVGQGGSDGLPTSQTTQSSSGGLYGGGAGGKELMVIGEPAVFESATTAHISSTLDSANNKVVIAYRDAGNSNYGTAVTIGL